MEQETITANMVAKVTAEIKKVIEESEEERTGAGQLRIFEEGLRKVLNGLGCELMGQEVTRKGREEEKKSRGCPKCGSRMRNVKRAWMTVQSIFGGLRVDRAHYYCEECRESVYPMDRYYGWQEHRYTQKAQEWICLVSQKEAYEEGAKVLGRVSGIEGTGETYREIVQSCGKRLLERRGAKAAEQYEETEVLKERGPCAERMLVGADGCHVERSGEKVGRPKGKKVKKKKGKRAKQGRFQEEVRERGMEVKVGLIGVLVRDPKKEYQVRKKSYVTTFEKAEVFTELLSSESLQRGVYEAKEVVVVGDGASWIWQRIAPLFERRVEILDWYHVSEKVWETGEVLMGPREQEATRQWVQVQTDRLWEGQGEKVLRELKSRRQQEETRERKDERVLVAINTLERYLTENKGRIDYPRYHRLGLPVGSSCVESANDALVARRMKCGGMQWRKESAEPLLHLRAEFLSDRWDENWNYLALAA